MYPRGTYDSLLFQVLVKIPVTAAKGNLSRQGKGYRVWL